MTIVELIWFLLPAGIANMAPVFATKLLPKWDAAVDGGFQLFGKSLFGAHKTIRGIVFGLAAAEITFLLQRFLFEEFHGIQRLSFINYHELSPWFGIWFGIGALGGDLVKSFLKRRFGIKPGEPWFPFDQIDWMVGTLVVTSFIFPVGLRLSLTLLILALILSAAAKWIGYLFYLNQRPI
ncbi:MAG: CDP-archaeol synthase [Bdellovibrionales bacterium]